MPSRPESLSRRRELKRVNTHYFGGKVNVEDAWQASFWCSRFGCTRQELREVVQITGTSAEAVRNYFEEEEMGLYRNR